MNFLKNISGKALAKTFTPVLNTENFIDVFGGHSGTIMPLDNQGFLRSLEFIAFPKTQFTILSVKQNHILEVTTLDYPYEGSFFVDSRFLIEAEENTPERHFILPSSSTILSSLFSLLGTRYFWGGNCPAVIETLTLYPPKEHLEEPTLEDWTLKGFDCSGLMYYVTNGFTPRNTSSWINFGQSISIKAKSLEGIMSLLKPLDAIVWKGHILFVYDAFHTIESRAGKGVILTDLKKRLESLIYEEKKTPHDIWQENQSQFLVRRWHPNLS